MVWGTGVCMFLSNWAAPYPAAQETSVSLKAFLCGYSLGKAGQTQNGHSGPPSVARNQKSKTNWLKENKQPPLGGPKEATQA